MTAAPETGSFLPYGRQQIEDDDIAAVRDVLQSDFLTTGPSVERFEHALCDVTGAEFAIACATGTAALHLANLSLGIGPGDACIVPSVTFAATASMVDVCGGGVIFADVNPTTGRVEPSHISDAFDRGRDREVRAIYGVDLAGYPCDRQALKQSARGAELIIDACHALGGTTHSGGRVGDAKIACMETFSFHPVKTIAMGEGGAVTTNDPKLADRARLLRNHGITRDPTAWRHEEMAFDADGKPNPWYYEVHQASVNYRVTDIQCALGASQLTKLSRFAQQRERVRRRYDSLLPVFENVLRPISPEPNVNPVLHLYAVLIDFDALGMSRRAFMDALRQQGVGTQVHYIPLHRQPFFVEKYGKIELPGSDAYYEKTLSLPLFSSMTENDADRVVAALANVCGLPNPLAS